LTRVGGFGEPAIDHRFHRVPQDIGDEEDDDGAQHAVGEAAKPCILLVEMGKIDTPTPGEYCCRADEQQRADAALQADGDDARRTFGNLRRTGLPKEMLDRAAADADRKRQDDYDQNQPEARHGMEYPKHPQQHDANRQQRVLGTVPEVIPGVRRRFRGVNQRDRAAPNCLERNGKEPKAEYVGNELAAG